MFTEDYLMRIINQTIAALLTAIGLRKAGKYSEARQAIDQAIEQVTTLPAGVVDQMEDADVLSMLAANGKLDTGRLAILADLYQEQGEILFRMDQPVQSSIDFSRALRFILEAALSEDDSLTTENIGKVGVLVQRLRGSALPVETQLALSDYYTRLLDKDDQFLVAAGTTREKIGRLLANLKAQIGQS